MTSSGDRTYDAVKVERLRARCAVVDGCWVYAGNRNDRGYPRCGYRGRTVHAHRLMYTLCVGPIADGLTIDHLCRNPSCINPDHLEPVTRAENIRRAFAARNAEVCHGRATPRRPLTHCRAGHEYTDENVRVTTRKDGTTYRTCRACLRARYAARRRPAAPRTGRRGHVPGTHCKRGHEYTPDNVDIVTRRNGKTTRECKECRRARHRACHARTKMDAAGQGDGNRE